MPPRPAESESDSDSSASAFNSYRIHQIESLNACQNLPAPLKVLFERVYWARRLYLPLRKPVYAEPCNQNQLKTSPADDYDGWLQTEALHLSEICNGQNVSGGSEKTWIQNMSRLFLQFNISKEVEIERDHPYRHCLACRRQFKQNSRPIIGYRTTARENAIYLASRQALKGRRYTNKDELCTNESHLNLPNLCMEEELHYQDTGLHKSKAFPDTTFGLASYNLGVEPWNDKKWSKLKENDMVRLFDREKLGGLMEYFDLKGPNPGKPKGPRNGKKKEFYLHPWRPVFSFGLWEAKKQTGQTHADAFDQTVPTICALLQWQRNLFNEAELRDEAESEDVCPLVWFFSSVGSSWVLWGCFETIDADSGRIYYDMVQLWRGTLAEKDEAYQLLHILDTIRFWAEYTYKPIVGTCLRRLHAMREKSTLTPLSKSLWASKIEINESSTPWMFKRSGHALYSTDLETHPETFLQAPRSSPRHHTSSPSRSPRRGASRRPSPAPQSSSEDRFVFPNSEHYNWILDRSTRNKDHVMLRVTERGTVLPPIALFDTAEWPFDSSKEQLYQSYLGIERYGYQCDADTGHLKVPGKRIYQWSLARSRLRHIKPDTQLCIILPLNHEDYHSQPERTREEQLFEPIEDVLKVGELLSCFELEKKRWCTCRCEWNMFSGPMRACDNVKCPLEWHHHRCVGLDEDEMEDEGNVVEGREQDYEEEQYDDCADDNADWLCPECEGSPTQQIKLRTKCRPWKLPQTYDEYRDASANRMQATRALRTVWDKHKWPESRILIEVIEKVSYDLDIIKESSHKIHRLGVVSALASPRYWVLPKEDPKLVLQAGPRRHQVIDYETSSDEDEEDNDDDTDASGTSTQESSNLVDDPLNIGLRTLRLGKKVGSPTPRGRKKKSTPFALSSGSGTSSGSETSGGFGTHDGPGTSGGFETSSGFGPPGPLFAKYLASRRR